MLECVINVSEGRDDGRVRAIAAAAGSSLLDVHTDADHHRSVITVVGVDAPRSVAEAAVATLDLTRHDGVHPRIGVLDVVPFVPLGDATLADAVIARDAMATWLADELGVPSFLYGPERTLPEVRRNAFVGLRPDRGPDDPHPTAGACAVGARPLLVAYNVWLDVPADDGGLDLARTAAAALRSSTVRTLGLRVGPHAQVSMNLIDPLVTGPAAVFDAVAALAPVARAELVGLVPSAVLHAVPPDRWAELDLAPDRTIEHRLAAATSRPS